MSFPVSEKIDAFTNKTTAQVEKWLGSDNEYFVLIDTPGLSVIAELFISDSLINSIPLQTYSLKLSSSIPCLSVCLSSGICVIYVLSV